MKTEAAIAAAEDEDPELAAELRALEAKANEAKEKEAAAAAAKEPPKKKGGFFGGVFGFGKKKE